MTDANKIYLSADSIEDVIRSLAIFYGVSIKDLRAVYENSWPDILSQEIEVSVFKDPSLAWCMGQQLNSDTLNRHFPVCFYHRTRFNGDPEWFSEGVLSNLNGVHAFFSKARELPDWRDEYVKAEILSKANIISRDSLERSLGPYAFDILDEAKQATKPGLDYSVPEFLIGGPWDSHPELQKSFTSFCREKLKAVIVKFYAHPQSYDTYIAHLWMYLHSQKFEIEYGDHFCYSFYGGGRTVPHNSIVELIKID